jgi:GNAT superfamily N-acetyltransferase
MDAPPLVFSQATGDDAAGLTALHVAVARDLTRRYGPGHWSNETSEKALGQRIATTHVVVVRDAAGEMAGTLELVTKKPWAIDRAYFTPVERPLYLINMAVSPGRQRQGIGRRCLEEALRLARAWPAQAICLDAYDAAAGAGGFYARCGFREAGRKVYRGVPLVYYERLVEPDGSDAALSDRSE